MSFPKSPLPFSAHTTQREKLTANMEGIGLRSCGEEILRLGLTVRRGVGGRIPILRRAMEIKMRDRSKNRKPLQRGRMLSIEAIQAVQALKRANPLLPPTPTTSSSTSSSSSPLLNRVIDTKFRRLLKFDMVAVLRELLRQNECSLSLKVRLLSLSIMFLLRSVSNFEIVFRFLKRFERSIGTSLR